MSKFKTTKGGTIMILLTKEQAEKARKAKNPQELVEMAKAEDIEISLEDAEMAIADKDRWLSPLSYEELEKVAGGGHWKDDEWVEYENGESVIWTWKKDGKRRHAIVLKFEGYSHKDGKYFYIIQCDGVGYTNRVSEDELEHA